jgi:hypothetical protein
VHDLCDELGLRCQVNITAGAAGAWTNVDDSPFFLWFFQEKINTGPRSVQIYAVSSERRHVPLPGPGRSGWNYPKAATQPEAGKGPQEDRGSDPA